MKIARSLSFYWARVRQASVAELAFRARQACLNVYIRRAVVHKWPLWLPVPPVERGHLDRLKLPEICGSVAIQEVERILQGAVYGHGLTLEVIQAAESAYRGRLANVPDIPGDSIDIRTVWEPARLQQLTYLLAALNQGVKPSANSDLKCFVRDALFCWIRDNSLCRGPHYISAMECGLRIPVFVRCLQALDDSSDEEHQVLTTVIYEHAWWIERNLSLYSSLGNHTVCESLGLVFAGALFSESHAGNRWLDRGAVLLSKELNHQVLVDGGPVEQSFSYHRFVLDAYWLASDFLQLNDLRAVDGWVSRLSAGEAFLDAMRHDLVGVPDVGDSDDGHVLAPGLFPRRGVRHTVRERAPPAWNCRPISGAYANDTPQSTASPSFTSRTRTFPDSGYTVMRGTDGLVLSVDHGPLGMAPLYNHGHADALSIVLSYGGQPFLVDPGTYRYNGEPEFRAYFRGTRAHNTVTVDGQDQAVQVTKFIWDKPFRTNVTHRFEDSRFCLVEAVHDGYARLPGSVLHRREVVLINHRWVLVTDTFEGDKVHRFELNYHVHPNSVIEPSDQEWLRILSSNRCLYVKVHGNPLRVFRGEREPPLGWFSSGYGRKTESSVLQADQRDLPTRVEFVSVLSPGEALTDEEIQRARTDVQRAKMAECAVVVSPSVNSRAVVVGQSRL